MSSARRRLSMPGDGRHASHAMILALGVLATMAIVWLGVENARLRVLRVAVETPVENIQGLTVGDVLPDVSLSDVSQPDPGGRAPVALREAARGVTVLFFFTTTCPYCMRSVPNVGQLQSELALEDVAVLTVALDGLGLQAKELPTAARDWRVLAPPDLAVARELRIPRVPTTVLVDDRSNLTGVWAGELTAALAREIQGAAARLKEDKR